MKKGILPAILQLILAILLFYGGACKQDKGGLVIQKTKDQPTQTKSNPDIPPYVLETLLYIQQHNKAPEGYVGGRTFENREKRLPIKLPNGTKIKYREWDVFPKQRGQNRGAERLITGSDESAWYTKNHYQSFIKIEHAAH